MASPFAGVAAAPAARRELRAWCALAVLALAIAGIFAVLLALSRTPGIQNLVPWPLDFFGKALVIHVVFAFVVSFLAIFGAVMQISAWQIAAEKGPRFAGIGGLGAVLAAAACVLLLVPALLDRGEPTLNNYIPAIIDPLYYAGLIALAVGLCLPVFRLVSTRVSQGRTADVLSLSGVGAAVIYLIALVCFGLAFSRLVGDEPSHTFNEDLFWGGGHMLQFLTTVLMIGAWSILARTALDTDPVSRPVTVGAIMFLVVFATPAPFLYLAFGDGFPVEQSRAFSAMLWALGPPTLVVALVMVRGMRGPDRARPLPWWDPAFLFLILSIGVFGVGGLLGMFIDGADTRTPAHYHASIAGVMLAFMGLFFALFFPLLGCRPVSEKAARFVAYAFAGGQTFASLGLFLAGGYGAPRKVAGAEQGLSDLGAYVGMAMNGIGALIAVAGGVTFIWLALRALFGASPRSPAA
ncbi:MAG: cbb3-type cytochrome c oxidase subunit I [Rhodospirillales bacterium]|nr:cbb3-type cytochrome c oxidase subunit I [Rhodospirillales bacterium]